MPATPPDSPVCAGAPSTTDDGARVASGPESREHNAEGLYVHGPLRAVPPIVRLIPDATEAPTTLPPEIVRAHQRMRTAERRRVLDRDATFRRALAGQLTGRRNRSRAA
jgi:hypothetical protein